MTTRSLLHITDCHIVVEGELLHGSVDSLGNLQRVLDAVVASGVPTDAIVLTGDLADAGAPGAYRRLRAVVEPAAARLDADVVYLMGNHDERSAFHAELLDDPEAGRRSHDAVRRIGGLRLIALDTTVPGHHHGEIDEAQYEWLGAQLAEPAPEGTIVALHHPPVPASDELHAAVGFRDAEKLIETLDGTDVRAVLAGHTHAAAASIVGSTFVWVGGALAYSFDGTAPAGMLRGRPAPAFSRIDITDGVVTATSIQLPPEGEQPVYEMSTAKMAELVLAHSAGH
ncbi:metallophosphoesterase family protein [Pseudonocardia sichuanensis]